MPFHVASHSFDLPVKGHLSLSPNLIFENSQIFVAFTCKFVFVAVCLSPFIITYSKTKKRKVQINNIS